MTILEAVNKLLEHFIKKDSFNLDIDYANLMNISESPDEDKISFILALEDMEKNDFIKSHQIGKKKIYILKKPIISYEQNLLLAGFTCNMIAKVINDFCEKIKDKRDYCDARSVNEKDIRNLIYIASLNSNIQDKSKQGLDE